MRPWSCARRSATLLFLLLLRNTHTAIVLYITVRTFSLLVTFTYDVRLCSKFDLLPPWQQDFDLHLSISLSFDGISYETIMMWTWWRCSDCNIAAPMRHIIVSMNSSDLNVTIVFSACAIEIFMLDIMARERHLVSQRMTKNKHSSIDSLSEYLHEILFFVQNTITNHYFCKQNGMWRLSALNFMIRLWFPNERLALFMTSLFHWNEINLMNQTAFSPLIHINILLVKFNSRLIWPTITNHRSQLTIHFSLTRDTK